MWLLENLKFLMWLTSYFYCAAFTRLGFLLTSLFPAPPEHLASLMETEEVSRILNQMGVRMGLAMEVELRVGQIKAEDVYDLTAQCA